METQITKTKQSIATISNEEFLKNYNLNNCLKVYKNLHLIEECLISQSPTLGTISREKGNEFTEAFLTAWLINLNEILNLNKPMTETQIIICVSEIMNDCYGMNIAELTLLFKRIMRGEFGEFYESLSISKVLTFFREYYEARLNKSFEINHVKHLDIKAEESLLDVSKNIKRIWKGTPSK